MSLRSKVLRRVLDEPLESPARRRLGALVEGGVPMAMRKFVWPLFLDKHEEVFDAYIGARHSSSFPGLGYAGTEAGFMIAGEGRTIYFSGDTDVMADMGVYQALHAPEIGILSCGGHFTMDMKRAAYAAKTFFDFKTVIPCHYKTFPLLAQDAEVLKAGLPGVDVIEPEVMTAIEL